MDNQEYKRDCYGLQYDRKVGCIPRPRRRVRYEDGSLTEDRSQLATSEEKRVTRLYERRHLLNELSKEVRAVMDDVIFALKCLECLKGRFGDDATALPRDVLSKEYQKIKDVPRKDIPREEHLLCGRLRQVTRERDLVVSAIGKYSRFLLSALPIPYLSPPTKPADDIVLLRIHKEDSNSPYYPGLGFFCGNWTTVSLEDNPTHKNFLNHMNDRRTSTGSPYISFHERPSQIITLQKKAGYHKSTNRVIAFSLNALKRLGTKVTRTTNLLASTTYSRYKFEGDGENFVHYASDSHWLVQHWASEEAKLANMSLDELKSLAVKHNIINEDGSYTYIGNYTISRDAFVEHERQKLSKTGSLSTSDLISEATRSLIGLEIGQTL